MNQNICFCSEPLNVNGAPPFYSLGASKSPVNMQGKRAKSNSFHVNERQTSCVTMKSRKKMDKYTIQSMWSQDTFAWPSICMTSREVFSGDSRELLKIVQSEGASRLWPPYKEQRNKIFEKVIGFLPESKGSKETFP